MPLQVSPCAVSHPGFVAWAHIVVNVLPAGWHVRFIAVVATGVHESPAAHSCVVSQVPPMGTSALQCPAVSKDAPTHAMPCPPQPSTPPAPSQSAPATGGAAHAPHADPVFTAQYPLWHCDA